MTDDPVTEGEPPAGKPWKIGRDPLGEGGLGLIAPFGNLDGDRLLPDPCDLRPDYLQPHRILARPQPVLV